jgi:hypothetical protein
LYGNSRIVDFVVGAGTAALASNCSDLWTRVIQAEVVYKSDISTISHETLVLLPREPPPPPIRVIALCDQHMVDLKQISVDKNNCG